MLFNVMRENGPCSTDVQNLTLDVHYKNINKRTDHLHASFGEGEVNRKGITSEILERNISPYADVHIL